MFTLAEIKQELHMALVEMYVLSIFIFTVAPCSQ